MKKKSKNGRLLENHVPTSTLIRNGKSQDLGKFDIYIINYDLLHKRIDDLSKLKLKSIICDEVQHLRSKSTKKYNYLLNYLLIITFLASLNFIFD